MKEKIKNNYMDTGNIDVTISEELIPYLCALKEGKNIRDKLILSAVIGLFVSKSVTLEKAAELVGKNVWDFIDILKYYGIPWGDYTETDLQMDELTLEKLAGGVYE